LARKHRKARKEVVDVEYEEAQRKLTDQKAAKIKKRKEHNKEKTQQRREARKQKIPIEKMEETSDSESQHDSDEYYESSK
jgi:hypothetical protein